MDIPTQYTEDDGQLTYISWKDKVGEREGQTALPCHTPQSETNAWDSQHMADKPCKTFKRFTFVICTDRYI